MRSRLPATALGIACALAVACGRKPVSIQVSPTKVKIYGVERPVRLMAQVLDKKGEPLTEGAAIAWSSSRADVAEVDPGGRVLSKKEGQAIVTATVGTLSAPVTVDVIDVKTIEVTPLVSRLVGPPGTSLPLQAVVKNSHDAAIPVPVTWSSSADSVATVSPDGVVTSAGAGKATILAKVGDLQTAAEIDVDTRTVSKLLLLPSTALVRVGDSQHYRVEVYGADGREINEASARFTSSDAAVAPVDAMGIVTGKKTGVATIRAQVGNLTAESTVIVN